MEQLKTILAPARRRYFWGASGVAAAALFVADLLRGPQVNLPILYPLLLMPMVSLPRRRGVWAVAFVLVALALVPLADPFDRAGAVPWWRMVNRGLAVSAILGMAGVLHVVHRLWSTASNQHDALVRQSNEVAQREEEIARQNEELQSQTEELERQSEELRIANEELANREKTLEQLLALSRSLTADLKRGQIMQIVCETMGFLLGGRAPAAAILERENGAVRVACHHGFQGGVDRETIPAESSFASIVLARGQTAYLEDTGLRPDLLIPQPKSGEPMRSILATPLRVKGRSTGTLEIYSHERRTWGEENVALLESLAAQTSISLEAAELFEEIEAERRRFEAVFRTLPIGVAVTDAKYSDVRLNPAGAAMLALSPGSNLGNAEDRGQLQAFVDGRLLEPPEWTTARALRGEEVPPTEMEIVIGGGARRVTILSSAAPIRDRERRVQGAVAAFIDIGQIKALQRELDRRRREAEEASVRKTRFLAAVSHDIRTPANAINLLAELMKRTASNPAMAAEIPQMADELQASATSLVNLVSDVLDITRFDTGKIDLHDTEFRLHEAVSEEVRQLQPLAAAKGLELTVQAPAGPLTVRGDRIKLGRIVSNLVGNAIKFTQQGYVRVGMGLTADRRVSVRVEDTGIGIAPEHQTRIFDEFFQLRNPERDATKGTGLGLTICKRLVEAMGGELAVESAPGKGSTFVVLLPADAVVPEAVAVAAPVLGASPAAFGVTALLAGVRVLLVEDHATTRQSQRRLLEREGAIVAEAGDGASAVRLVQTFSPNVVLLDLMLPDMPGQDVLRAIAGNRPRELRAILVLTGEVSDGVAAEARRLGADDVIAKPVNVKTLVQAIRSGNGSEDAGDR